MPTSAPCRREPPALPVATGGSETPDSPQTWWSEDHARAIKKLSARFPLGFDGLEGVYVLPQSIPAQFSARARRMQDMPDISLVPLSERARVAAIPESLRSAPHEALLIPLDLAKFREFQALMEKGNAAQETEYVVFSFLRERLKWYIGRPAE